MARARQSWRGWRVIGFAACFAVLASAGASPPDDESGAREFEPPVLLDDATGFWLSVELIGPRGAQLAAAESLLDGPVEAGLPRGGRPPPGDLVGRVDTLEDALAWVDRHAFGVSAVGFPAAGVLAEREAPIPGGTLYEKHGVVPVAWVVTAAESTPYVWPGPGLLATPSEATWLAAELIGPRVPVFAAPAPFIPRASERYVELRSSHDLWLLGLLDRCDDTARCQRWAQIVFRDGDRFRAGWLPSFHAVPFANWLRDDTIAGRPRRFALIEGHREPGRVGFVLIEREGDTRVHTTSFVVEHVGNDWPSAGIAVLTGTLVVTIGGKVVHERELAGSMLEAE